VVQSSGGRTAAGPRRRPAAVEDVLVGWILAEHGHAMLVYAVGLTGDREAAQDAVQEALVRAWLHPDSLVNGRGSVRGWLLTTVRNIVTDSVRARNVRPREVTATGASEPVSRDHADLVVSTLLVRESLTRLSPGHRAVVEQVYLHGRSVSQAAERLGIPPGTVKSRAHHALRALRALSSAGCLPLCVPDR
jgi:RNA polymerase sigma-70 factor, ECF subfamily